MSYLSISNRYSMYSSLISQTYSTGGTSSVASTNSLLGMYSNIYGANSSKGSTVSSQTSSYMVNLKKSASDVLDAVDTIKSLNDKKNVSANSSDSASVSAKYKGTEKRDDIEIDVSRIATAQVNESSALKTNSSSLYYSKASGISITTGDGKTHSFNYSSSINETDGKALEKIAQKINKADIGVTASVETDSKTKTSKLVLKGEKTGAENDFSVSGDLAEKIGLNKIKTAASDAIYSINGEEKVSSSNKIQIDDDLSITLNKATDDTAKITFGKSNIASINAARELVNVFNGLANTAYSTEDSGAEKLGNRLQSIAKSYGAALDRIGISLNGKGYLEIDEDKMKEAAESGELSKFFDNNGKAGLSYGFINRLENVANRAFKDPTSFLSGAGKAEVNGSSNSGSGSYLNSASPVSYNYISAYYRYSTAAMLFSTMV